jgi:uncharacterized membrane-anchored protein
VDKRHLAVGISAFCVQVAALALPALVSTIAVTIPNKTNVILVFILLLIFGLLEFAGFDLLSFLASTGFSIASAAIS